VSMVGHDLKLDEGIGTCGKDGQSVPVGVGIAYDKLDKMTVGGRDHLEGGITVVIDFVAFALQQQADSTDSLRTTFLKISPFLCWPSFGRFTHTIDKQQKAIHSASSASIPDRIESAPGRSNSYSVEVANHE